MKFITEDDSLTWDSMYSEKFSNKEEKPDLRVGVIQCETMMAHAALWWKDAPHMEDEKLGVLGGFHAENALACKILLEEVERIFRDHRCSLIVGPMNGNTWRKHRFVSWSDGTPEYFLEPITRSDYLEWWKDGGFSPLEEYSSSRVNIGSDHAISSTVVDRLYRNGVTIRGVEINRLEEELAAIHEVCLKCFRENFLYTPMACGEFVARYKLLDNWIFPDYVRMAFCRDELCGFVFSMPDPLANQMGHHPSLIVKTLAVLPSREFAGLGTLLVEQVHQAAWDHGIKHAIHALQRNDNSSRRITSRFSGEIFRKYQLLKKSI
jgi:GNAT superfamily N-acetyltransferase